LLLSGWLTTILSYFGVKSKQKYKTPQKEKEIFSKKVFKKVLTNKKTCDKL